ncbi:membrane protein insertion efficiency factor YidD [candidate division FCPU426 bacterium]|nr:membrane protein insertion efficiency factor YidD [candidate division FCPU426 bacterium]
MRKLAKHILQAYKKYVSPFIPAACRFYPTCSEYTNMAIQKYGILKGGYLGMKRLVKCHPFHKGGFDPLI